MPVRTAPSSWQPRRGMAVKMLRLVDPRMQRTMQSHSLAQSLRPPGISLKVPTVLRQEGAIPIALKYRQATAYFILCGWHAVYDMLKQPRQCHQGWQTKCNEELMMDLPPALVISVTSLWLAELHACFVELHGRIC